MLRILALISLFTLAACNDRSSDTNKTDLSTADSTVVAPGADTGPLVDTDDHNKPSVETVTLDSPSGPDKSSDTAAAKEKERR